MKVLVTGRNGFIGGNLVKELKTSPLVSEIKTEIDGFIDAVLHQAAITKTFGVTREEMFSANYYYPKALFTDLFQKGCQRFILASSTAIYGNLPVPHREQGSTCPLNDYAESKLRLEDFLTEFGLKHSLNVVILRYCNVFGPGEDKKGPMASMIYQIINQIKQGQNPRLFRDGNQKRDWIYVEDVVNANLKALQFNGVDIFNCGSGKATSFNYLLELINQCMCTNAVAEYTDNPYIDFYQNSTLCDMSKAKDKLGFEPLVSLKEGIVKLLHYN